MERSDSVCDNTCSPGLLFLVFIRSDGSFCGLLNANDLKKTIKKLEVALRKLGPEYGVALRPQKPATEKQILAYEKHLGLALPASYRAFLLLHNGYRGLAFPGDMLSIEAVMPGGAEFETIKRWKKMSMKNGADEVADAIVIASHVDGPNHWTYLDPHQLSAKTHEMKVVEWEPSDSQAHATVLTYLEECLETATSSDDD